MNIKHLTLGAVHFKKNCHMGQLKYIWPVQYCTFAIQKDLELFTLIWVHGTCPIAYGCTCPNKLSIALLKDF